MQQGLNVNMLIFSLVIVFPENVHFSKYAWLRVSANSLSRSIALFMIRDEFLYPKYFAFLLNMNTDNTMIGCEACSVFFMKFVTCVLGHSSIFAYFHALIF